MSRDDEPEAPSSMLPLLLRLYIPVMLLSALAPAVGIAGLALIFVKPLIAVLIAMAIVFVCGAHVLFLLIVSSKKLKHEKDWFEMALEPDLKVKLREFVVDIAREWDMPRPEDIRLSSASAAHVYESKKGQARPGHRRHGDRRAVARRPRRCHRP